MKYKLILAALGIFLGASCEYNSIEVRVNCKTSNLAVRVTEKQEASCGQSDGSLKVVASGGSRTYTFSINDGPFQEDSVFRNIKAGSYRVTVKDHTCTASADAEIINKNGLNISATTTNAGCSTSSGTITAATSGGEAPVMFSLNSGSFSSSPTFENLVAGSYTLLARDATGCEVTKTVRVASGVSFANTISTIIAANCAVPGCHNGSRGTDFRSFQNIQGNAAIIKQQTGSRNMPLTGSLTQEQIDAIACWVDDGALNN